MNDKYNYYVNCPYLISRTVIESCAPYTVHTCYLNNFNKHGNCSSCEFAYFDEQYALGNMTFQENMQSYLKSIGK